MQIQIDNVQLEAIQGDIANQDDISAIVNAANARLETGGGVAGAIHRAAGPGLTEECRPMAPIQPGEAVISGAHNLPNSYIIHCLGPVYGSDKPEDKLLADCYRNSLRKAEENGIDSIAFPAISTGAFGYPFEAPTDVALKTITEPIPELNLIKRVWHYLEEKVVNNYFFGTLDRLTRAVQRACRELNSTADKILDIDFRTEEDFCLAA